MKPATPKPIITEDSLVHHRQQGLSLIPPLRTQVEVLSVTTAQHYEQADTLLARIAASKAAWESRINPIIQPIRAGLDLLYALRRDILEPLEELEGKVKARMREFKLAEAKQLRIEQATRDAEIARLQAEAEEKAAREMGAKTRQLRDRISASRAVLEQALATKIAEQPVGPIKVLNSSPRTVKKWRVTDLGAFIAFILAQEPETRTELLTLISIDSVQMEAFYKLSRKALDAGEWMPGVEVYEDINIGRR